MKVTSQDTQRGTTASTISALTVRTRTLIRGTMTPIDSVTAGLPNISAKLAEYRVQYPEKEAHQGWQVPHQTF